MVLVADDEPANRLFAVRVLGNAGWDVVEAVDGEEAVAVATEAKPQLIVMDMDMPYRDGWAATAAIRALPSPLSTVPILAWTTMRVDDEAARAGGLDGCLPKPCPPDRMAAAVARWRPDGEMAGAERLATIFGAEEMAKLVARFREQLSEALGALDAGDTGAAHRIAGVAGTLGFAEVSEAWLRLSEGDRTARDPAYRAARMAIASIDRTT